MFFGIFTNRLSLCQVKKYIEDSNMFATSAILQNFKDQELRRARYRPPYPPPSPTAFFVSFHSYSF